MLYSGAPEALEQLVEAAYQRHGHALHFLLTAFYADRGELADWSGILRLT
jgi:hypothetical protein